VATARVCYSHILTDVDEEEEDGGVCWGEPAGGGGDVGVGGVGVDGATLSVVCIRCFFSRGLEPITPPV
jgi:hypothetical protein